MAAKTDSRDEVHAFVADLHLSHRRTVGSGEGRMAASAAGVPDLCAESVETLHRAMTVAKGRGVKHFWVLGDLFDTPHPSPQIVALVAAEMCYFADMTLHLISGNHDAASMHPRDTALASLAYYERVEVEDEGLYEQVFTYSYFAAEQLKEACADVRGEGGDGKVGATCRPTSNPVVSVLAAHVGLRDSRTPEHLLRDELSVHVEDAARVARRFSAQLFVSGHWHKHHVWRGLENGLVDVVQVGTLCPSTFSDAGLDDVGKMVLYYPVRSARERVDVCDVPGLRFVRVKQRDLSALSAANHLGDNLRYVLDVATTPGNEQVALTTLRELRERRIVYAWNLSAASQDEVANIGELRGVVGVAELSEYAAVQSPEQAVSAYVRGMELPSSVVPEVVEQLAVGYVRAAREAAAEKGSGD